ncbi:MAG: CBS domain-containing protein [Myxococcaceae bacterium]|nr:CBS domain-containing protein [Myxococcaceae bacterium]
MASKKKATAKGLDPVSTTVKSIMSKKVQAVRPDTSLDTAVELLMTKDISHLPVTEDGKLVGILSKTDVVRDLFLNGNDGEVDKTLEVGFQVESSRVVSDLMAKRVRTVQSGSSVAEAAAAMARFRVHGMPVVDDEQLVGFVSTIDIARWVVG